MVNGPLSQEFKLSVRNPNRNDRIRAGVDTVLLENRCVSDVFFPHTDHDRCACPLGVHFSSEIWSEAQASSHRPINVSSARFKRLPLQCRMPQRRWSFLRPNG